MSNENKETIADIVGAMRNEGRTGEASCLDWIRTKMTYYADLIEAAAAKREREANREKSSQVGNAAAMREALKRADAALSLISKSAWFIDANFAVTKAVIEAGNEIEAALANPPRNCDVMDWRTAWAKWRTEIHPQNPCGYAEAYRGTEQFMDWYMSEAKGETK